MKIIKKPIKINELWETKESDFQEMLKIVVDIEREIVAIDAELYADLESILLENGSNQKDIWGANVYPDRIGEDFLEYTAFINIRPSQNNKSMEIIDQEIQRKVKEIATRLLLK
jgi:hypothetical protein